MIYSSASRAVTIAPVHTAIRVTGADGAVLTVQKAEKGGGAGGRILAYGSRDRMDDSDIEPTMRIVTSTNLLLSG